MNEIEKYIQDRLNGIDIKNDFKRKKGSDFKNEKFWLALNAVSSNFLNSKKELNDWFFAIKDLKGVINLYDKNGSNFEITKLINNEDDKSILIHAIFKLFKKEYSETLNINNTFSIPFNDISEKNKWLYEISNKCLKNIYDFIIEEKNSQKINDVDDINPSENKQTLIKTRMHRWIVLFDFSVSLLEDNKNIHLINYIKQQNILLKMLTQEDFLLGDNITRLIKAIHKKEVMEMPINRNVSIFDNEKQSWTTSIEIMLNFICEKPTYFLSKNVQNSMEKMNNLIKEHNNEFKLPERQVLFDKMINKFSLITEKTLNNYKKTKITSDNMVLNDKNTAIYEYYKGIENKQLAEYQNQNAWTIGIEKIWILKDIEQNSESVKKEEPIKNKKRSRL